MSDWSEQDMKREREKHANDVKDWVCVVTGASGFVGLRLVEMLLERGASRVVALDIVPFPDNFAAAKDPRVSLVLGDIRDSELVSKLCEGAHCVWHNAAAVGPFHPMSLYEEVNHGGTLNVIRACRQHGVTRIVMSSSPSTRMTGEDLDGVTEDQLPSLPLPRYVQEYAASKARGEMALRAACDDSLFTVAVAPHQVYGPRDNLFLPNILEAAGTGRLRVLGAGHNRVCLTHADNYAHGLILGALALYKDSPALGKFYIVTDMETHTDPRGCVKLYEELDRAVVGMGWPSIYSRWAVPRWLLMIVAYLMVVVTWITGFKVKITPFTVTMMTMDRWFVCDNAKRDLGYRPIASFKREWPRTIEWFRRNWLPGFEASDKGITGLFSGTQRKIDIQAGKKKR